MKTLNFDALHSDVPKSIEESNKGPQFSLGAWTARLNARCAQTPRNPTASPMPVLEASGETTRNVTATPAPVSSCLQGGPAAGLGNVRGNFFEEIKRRQKANELVASKADVEFLRSLFHHRDASRARHTILPIASLIRGRDTETASEAFDSARVDLFAMAHESWTLLQERHPSATPALEAPCCPTYLQPIRAGSSESSRTSIIATDHSNHTSSFSEMRLFGEKSSGFGEKSNGFDAYSCDTPSTLDCSSPRESWSLSERSSSMSTAVSTAHHRLVSVVEIDDVVEDRDPCTSAPPTPEHRDDWELQYMMFGALDEVCRCLEHGSDDAFGETAAMEAIASFETLQDRVLAWTVKRWYKSCESK